MGVDRRPVGDKFPDYLPYPSAAGLRDAFPSEKCRKSVTKNVKCVGLLLTGGLGHPRLAREFKHGPQMVPGSNPDLVFYFLGNLVGKTLENLRKTLENPRKSLDLEKL